MYLQLEIWPTNFAEYFIIIFLNNIKKRIFWRAQRNYLKLKMLYGLMKYLIGKSSAPKVYGQMQEIIPI